MPLFRGAKDLTFQHSAFTDVGRDNYVYYGAQETVLDILKSQVATGAFHNSNERFDPPRCHPQTRIAVLSKIRAWYECEEMSTPRILWLYGPAGSGKSAISQSMAEECHEVGTLAASFFFSRTALGRNDATRLIATIAYQVAHSIPNAQPHIRRELENDPMVFSKSLDTQLHQLVARPLSVGGVVASVSRPKLIIIDGLDECSGGEAQQAIIRSFASLVTHCNVLLRIMISSRSEQPIRDALSLPGKIWTYVPLGLDDEYQPDRDIELFLRENFSMIRQTHTLKSYIPATWPSDQDIVKLVQKSSGQFIFASTTIKYVKSPRHRPMIRLRDVLQAGKGNSGSDAFGELDTLYMHVLESADQSQYASIMSIFGFLLCTDPKYNREPSMIEEFLGLTPGDIYLALADYHSIVHLPPLPSSAEEFNTKFSVHFLHASISDFLLDPTRSKQFFVDRGATHAELTRACMRGVISANLSVRAFSSWNLIRHSESARMDKGLIEDLLRFNLSDLFLEYEVHDKELKYLTRSSPWMRYRASLDQMTWIKRLYHTGRFHIPEIWLNHHLTTIDHYLRRQIHNLPWPSRSAELFSLASKLQSSPRQSTAVHWNMPLPDAWKHAGILLGLDVVNAYLSNSVLHDFIVCVSFTHNETVEVEKLYLDFLHHPQRAGEYCINGVVYARIALKCVDYICGKDHGCGANAEDGSGLIKGSHDPRTCNHSLEALPSILLSATPIKELEAMLTSREDLDVLRKNSMNLNRASRI